MLAVVLAGLGIALWLPTRNDSASAHENGGGDRRSQAQQNARGSDNGGDDDNGWGYQGVDDDNGWGYNGGQDGDGRDDRTPTPEPTESTEPPVSPEPSYSPTTTPPPPSPVPPSTSPAAEVTRWVPFKTFTAGQFVSFKGTVFQVVETHTSLPDWEPDKLLQLFAPV
jgi:hypothetical protein